MKIPSIKSPLRYPGGKSRALKQILPIIPEFKEFREPMVGGGSIFFALKQLNPNCKFWINDVNKELFFFWKYLKEEPEKMIKEISKLKEKYSKDGKKLYEILFNMKSDFERAVRFFILNRITFSGLAESGGYSEQAFKTRFTDSSIERLKRAADILQNTSITNEDYEELIIQDGEEVFIFLDPPYYSTKKSKLYGKNGNLHEEFNHERFRDIMKECKHKFLITYDDSEKVRGLFDDPNFFFIYPWELQYGMNNYKQKKAKKGSELFISNFKIPSLECSIKQKGNKTNEVI